MQVFFTQTINQDEGLLTGQEAIHCSRVLRHKTGDVIQVVDGAGALIEGRIDRISKDSVEFAILGKEIISREATEQLPTIAFGILKNDTRMEWMIEKTVEIGIRGLVPLICGHSEKQRIRYDRLQKIMISAMKQSNRRYLPVLHEPVRFKDWLAGQLPSTILMAHYSPEHKSLSDLSGEICGATIIIGPEGDFTDEEKEWADQQEIRKVNLSEFRLRSETAAILACAICNTRNK